MRPIELMRRFGVPSRALVHIGANTGHERFEYRDGGVGRVLWVEPIPQIFAELGRNLERFPGQKAVQAVCTAQADQPILFNVSNNNGESSSIFGLGRHAELYPRIRYSHQLEMRSTTLDALIGDEAASADFNLLVMDVQGAELEVLKGGRGSLPQLDGLFLEVSEHPLYEGGCTLAELVAFLEPHGFRVKWLEVMPDGIGDAFFLNDAVFRPQELPAAGPNLALGGPAQQSSAYPLVQHGSPVDGVLSGTFGFHTEDEDEPWWQVDLGGPHTLQEIRIHNRGDMMQDRAASVKVLLSNDGAFWKTVHAQRGMPFGLAPKYKVLRVPVSGEVARFVRLQLHDRAYFHLDEVEVF